MNRLKLLAMATLLAVPLVNACGDDVVPPASTGSIAGQVAIEGQGIDGITVTLSSGETAITAGGGAYRFDDLEADTYTITIKNYPTGGSFDATSASATLAKDGEVVTVNFAGSWMRTSAITGAVTVENDGLNGVTVKISGVSDSEIQTGADGRYAFSGLRAGDYTIEISGFDPNDITFGSTPSAVTISVDESKVVNFEGTYVRTAAIMGQISVEGTPLEGVTVSLQGEGENRTKTTNSAGQYMFEDLRSGDYSVGISGYDTDEYGFATTSKTITVASGETVGVPFEGTAVRTAAVMGTITIESRALEGVTVSLSGEGENRTKTTNSAGQYMFEDLRSGDYSVGISGYDTDEYGFATTSKTITVASGETVGVPFEGTALRTAAIMGTITIESGALEGVTASLSGEGEDRSVVTNAAGQYAFNRLLPGDYSVGISGYDTDEYGFATTSKMVALASGETASVPFEGTALRTAAIMGTITIESRALEGVTASLSGEGENRSVVTNAAGQYAFNRLLPGDYSVGISGYDTDEYGFATTSKMVAIASGETVGVPFEGTALRTAAIMGTITIESRALEGVTASLRGEGENRSVVTNAAGQYAFNRLLPGDYSVGISGYDTDEYGFATTSKMVALASGETASVPFEGTALRTAAIMGTITIESGALEGVTASLSGEGENRSVVTNAAGQYAFNRLLPGDYSVGISGYDTDEYGFDATSKSVSVALNETATVEFDGIMLGTAEVAGQVSVDGSGLGGVTVTLTGEEDRSRTTSHDGRFFFSGLAPGDYTLSLSGYDADEYQFDASLDITLALGESKTANVMGRSLRTVGVLGTVMAEGEGIAEVPVTLIRVLGANSDQIVGTLQTIAGGAYAFDKLLAGTYRVEIAGFDDEYDFEAKSWTGAVATDETATADFNATIIRTASVGGAVLIDGEGMMGVEVTLTGVHAPDDNAMETLADGGYVFDGLRKSGYTVTITNPDEDLYDFPTTSRSVTLTVGQERDDVSFAGEMLRKASIGGQVYVEGVGLEGVTVVLSGDSDAEATTDDNGEYDFPGLAGGDYTVEISGWDDVAYEFETTELDVVLDDDPAGIVDFPGSHTATAWVSGVLFLDEIEDDGALADGEPALEGLPEIPLLLHGPGMHDVTTGATDANGAYAFDGLKAGSYRVLINWSNSLTAALREAGYRFTGEVTGEVVDLTAAASETVNFPFQITMQTILVGAVMGNATQVGDPVDGVVLALYPTARDAEKGANSLGTATTAASGNETGFAMFEFAREDDVDEAGNGTDHLVYAKIVETGHEDLVVLDNARIEIEYEAVDRVSHASAALRLLNTRVNFQWSVKSDADAKDGNRFLEGWVAKNGIATDADGKAIYSAAVNVSELPKTFAVALNTVQADAVDMDERWVQSAAPTYIHDGLALPSDNAASDNNLGPIYVTWKTQSLLVGVYREADQAPGYTGFQSKLAGGDHRPVPSVGNEMTVELLERDSQDSLQLYKWDHDNNPGTDDQEGYATIGANGLVRFAGIPAGDEITIRFQEGDDRVRVTELENVETFSADLDIGATVGAFGAMSGGVPEVRICTASEGTGDEACATFGYQWTTGAVSGNVGKGTGHKVVLEPATDGRGALGDSTESGKNGAYSFTGLHDGHYAITASGTATYKVDGEPTQSVWVYHDETSDDRNSLTTYVGTAGADKARWTTTRINLKIMGYIGNDASSDKLMRGDEALAGVAVRLTRGPEAVATVETNDRGLYVFDNLEEGTYAVTASSGRDYLVLRAFDPNTGAAIATATATADEYPPLREGHYRLPSWDYETNSANNTSVPIRKSGSTALVTLVNFALVYIDGELSGGVSNVSGGEEDIDFRIYRERDDQLTEVTTDSRGRFETGELMEGSYRVEIEDARFAAPCLTSATGTPDDDGPDDNADGVCDHLTALEIDSDLRGRQAHANLDILHVYDTKLFADDSLGDLPGIKARMQGRSSSTYNDTVTWTPDWTREQDTEETRSTTLAGTISWASKSITFSFPEDGSIPAGAGVVVSKDTTVCADHTCELDYNKTGTPNASPKETTLTVTVTAENSYDDHIYSVAVARVNPVGNELFSDRVRRHNGDDTYTDAGGYGTLDEPYTLQTDSAEATSFKLHINLKHLGVLDDNAACAQSLIVKTNPDDEDVEAEEVEADADARDDICANERYTLNVAARGANYTLHVLSEDGVEKVHHLAVSRGPEN